MIFTNMFSCYHFTSERSNLRFTTLLEEGLVEEHHIHSETEYPE